MVEMNVALAIFNLLPVPPLDGSRIVAWLLPYRLQQQWHQLEQFSMFLLIPVILYGGRLVAGPIGYLTNMLFSVARSIALA
jgi:Zn-dependent protease